MYICRRLRLYGYLTKQGFIPIESKPDVKNEKYTVWLYKMTPELRIAIEEYYTTVPVK